MNKVVEYVIKAKDLISSTLDKVGKNFGQTAYQAKQAELAMKNAANAKKQSTLASKELQDVLAREEQKMREEEQRTKLLKEATDRLVEAKKRLAAQKYSANTAEIQKEIKQLEGAIRDLGGEKGIGGLEKRIGGFGGQLGSVLGKIGKFGGQAAAIIGAWKIGTEIGEKICDWFEIGPKFVRERLIKENKKIAAEQEQVFNDFVERLDEITKKGEVRLTQIDDEIKEIDALAAAYNRLETAKNSAMDADAKAAELSLKREKFEKVRATEDPTEKQRIGLDYDIKIAELRSKSELEKFDRESALADKKAEDLDEKLSKLNDKRSEIQSQLFETGREMKMIDTRFNNHEIDADQAAELDEKVASRREGLEQKIKDLDFEIEAIENEIEAIGEDKTARGKNRANLAETLRQEIEARKAAVVDFEKKNEEAYEKELEAEWDAWYKEQERMAAEEEKIRQEKLRAEQELQKKIHAQKLHDIQEEVRESEGAMRSAESRVQAAKSAVSRAWGWYRNTDTMQAEIDNFKAQQEAEKKWEKDFANLKDKYGNGWRRVEFGKLSAEEEATRQVALAKEEERAAQDALDNIVKNTEYLKEIADALNTEEDA